MAQMAATSDQLRSLGVDSLAIVGTELDNARLYFKFRPSRLALGADPWSIVRLVMANAIRPVGYGLAFGVVAAVIGRASLRPPLFPPQLASIDATSLALAIAPLVIASAVACYVPARRAASLDPNEALRHM